MDIEQRSKQVSNYGNSTAWVSILVNPLSLLDENHQQQKQANEKNTVV